MQVDITLVPSRMQQGVHALALVIVAVLLCSSGLSWPMAIILVSILLGFDQWLRQTTTAHRIASVWQGDSQTWYWQQGQGRRLSGQLLAVRHLGVVIHLTLKTTRQPTVFLPIWRDQVSDAQWRRLCVLHRLNDSQQNWF